MMSSIALLVNPTQENDKALRVADEVCALLDKKAIPCTVFDKVWPNTLDGYRQSWICGGDGTINHYINQFPDVNLPIALLGGGSGNDFHWMLYGITSVSEQVEGLLHGNQVRVDAGICNGKLFLNGVGIGFDGKIVSDLQGRKKLAGKASYLLSILKNIVAFQEKPGSIRMDGELLEQDCFMISIANGVRYGGGFKVAPRASLSDGMLDINIVGRIAPFKRIKYLPVIEKGEHLNLPFIHYRHAKTIAISFMEKMHAHIDGEYLYMDHFNISILPSRFSFLLPPVISSVGK